MVGSVGNGTLNTSVFLHLGVFGLLNHVKDIEPPQHTPHSLFSSNKKCHRAFVQREVQVFGEWDNMVATNNSRSSWDVKLGYLNKKNKTNSELLCQILILKYMQTHLYIICGTFIFSGSNLT